MSRNIANNNYLFCQLAVDWHESVSLNVKISTRVKYQNMLNNYALPLLGQLYVEDINYVHLENLTKVLLSNRDNQENGLSHKTVSDVLTMIRSILRYGQRKGYAISSDVLSYKMKTVQKPIRVFSRSEQETICQKIFENMSILNLGILFTLFTGLRIGELCALQWKDISFDDMTVRVDKTMQRIQTLDTSPSKTRIIISAPKTVQAIRQIPIARNLLPFLHGFRKEPDDYFLSDANHTYIEPRMMQRYFKKFLESCEINDGTFHTLRHYVECF